MTAGETEELEDQYERTLLSWRRTALSLVATGLLVGHLAGRERGGEAVLLATLLSMCAVVAYVWLGRARTVGASGLVLVLGVAVLAGVALAGSFIS